MKLKSALAPGKPIISILAGWMAATLVCSCGNDDSGLKSGTIADGKAPGLLAVDGKNAKEQLKNSIDMELIWCPKGEFIIGSPDEELYRMKNEAQNFVNFSRGFWLGKTEVTQAEWKAVMGEESNPSSFKTSGRRPVENVTWKEAMEYCQTLTKKERAAGILPSGWTYTLPTEAQWEYGCRAGTEGPYAGELEFMAWHKDNSYLTTHEVDKMAPNPWGFHDMHGNVWEWCRDFFASANYKGGVDPKGPKSGTKHVTRGGGWDTTPRYCRSAFRSFPGRLGPKIKKGTIGFRVVLERASR